MIEAKEVTQAQQSRDAAVSKSTVSEILAGKKRFSRQMIRRFADYFGVAPNVLAANFRGRTAGAGRGRASRPEKEMTPDERRFGIPATAASRDRRMTSYGDSLPR